MPKLKTSFNITCYESQNYPTVTYLISKYFSPWSAICTCQFSETNFSFICRTAAMIYFFTLFHT